MKKTKRTVALCMSILASVPVMADSWEVYDRVIAVVNSEPIIESQINTRFEFHQSQKKVSPKEINYEKSRVLDEFIEDAIIRETAYNEAIVISDVRVMSHIETVLSQYFMQKLANQKEVDLMVPKISKRLSNRLEEKQNPKDDDLDKKLDEFIAFIEKNQKMPFKEYFEEIRRQMRKDQVMSISIGVTPPSDDEAMKWYNENRKMLPDEVWVKHILIKPRGSSFTDEKKANDLLTSIRGQVLGGKSFEELARKYSEDPGSAANGGDVGWMMLNEFDPYFAGYVNQMRRPGEISQVFKSSFGYHIAKLVGRRPVQFDKVKRMILYKLYGENRDKQFDKWVMQKKKSSDIKIYMKEYLEKKKI